jgi:hypothetical protein
MKGDELPRGFAQAPSGAVADDGIADLLGGGEADAGGGEVRRRTSARLDGERRAPLAFALGDILEFGPLPELADRLD